VEIARIRRAAEVVKGRVRRTPLLRSSLLDGALLKCECLQVTGSFKVRGAYAAVAAAPGPVFTASAGNHGLGLATAAREFGVPCTVVVPRSVPAVKEEGLRALGATVLKSPFDGYDDTEAWARERAAGARWVSPYDDPDVIAGNGGTTAMEIFDEADVDAVVVPCGGAGLAIGVGVAARALSPKTRVIAVNTEASPALWMSRRDGRAVTRLDFKPTIAEGLEGGISELNVERARRFVDDVIVVPEPSLRRAVREVAMRERLVIEGSAAAGVAAVLEGLVTAPRLAIVLTGSNIDRARLATLLRE
jgi:threonine dehydratase